MGKEGKATNAQYLERVKEVEMMLLDGEPRTNILDNITQKYSVSVAQVGYYITDAYKRITAINKATLDENRGWVLRNLIEVYRKAYKKEDFVNSLKALKQIAEITGIESMTINVVDEYPDLKETDVVTELEQRCQLAN